MNIAVISIYKTPLGMAATNRILSYSKGLIYHGHNVTIYNPFPTDILNNDKLDNKGCYEGVRFFYTSGRYLFKNKYLRVLNRKLGVKRIIGYLTSSFVLIKQQRNRNIDFLIISNDSLRDLLFYSVIAKILKSKSVFIFDEYPIPIRHKLKIKIPKWKSFLYSIILKNIDLFISISKELSAYYNKLSKHNTFILPVIVDTSRFDKLEKIKPLYKENYLCYMGNMELAKDDVDNIIRAFSLISLEFKELNLYLFGSPSSETKDRLEKLIFKLGLNTRVFLKGRISGLEVPITLMNAKILVSSQPNTVRAKGGFPTKLGEYLASGVPALFTDVGENSKYVKNGVHLFFVKAENSDLYAHKLREILYNYEDSVRIAKKGKEFVHQNYSHIIKGKYLADFLKNNN